MSIGTSSGNSIVTADLVRTVWNDYIAKIPNFLHAVTLHVQELENPGSAGTFKMLIPNYSMVPYYAGLDHAYQQNEYFSTTRDINWNSNNIKVSTYSVRQYDRSLLMNNEEYRMNFISSVLMKVLLSFEIDFAYTLQRIVPGQTFYTTSAERTEIWNTIFPVLPKTQRAAGVQYFDSKEGSWYRSNSATVTNPTYNLPALAFVPCIAALGGWILQSCSRYARYMGLKEPRLACSGAVMEAICTEYDENSSTTSLIGSKIYNSPGCGISNGYLTAYTLPQLQVIYDFTGWTQGVIFKIISATNSQESSTIILTLQVLTKTANLPVAQNLFISKYTPLTLSLKKYSPTTDIADSYVNQQYAFDSGNWATVNSLTDIVFTSGIVQGSTFPVTVSTDQIRLPYYGGFPMVDILQYQNVVVTTPWRDSNFQANVTADNFRCVVTGAMTLHYSYLHSKENTHVFVVKQRDVGGGIESEEEKIADKVPFRMFEKGDVSEGTNDVVCQGIMAMGITPELGGQLMSWSSYPNTVQIIPSLLSAQGLKDDKASAPATLLKYQINLDFRLLSYMYDPNNVAVLEEQAQYIVPTDIYDLTLITDYSTQYPTSIPDPIVAAINRGLTADRMVPATYEIYKDHFPPPMPKAEEMTPVKKERKTKVKGQKRQEG